MKDQDKQYIVEYFEKNKNNKNVFINKSNFTTALRRLISRYLISSRQEIEIKPEIKLSLYIGKNEFWTKDISSKDTFEKEIFDICKDGITVGNSFELYEILQGDKILNLELGIEEEDNPENPPYPPRTNSDSENDDDDRNPDDL